MALIKLSYPNLRMPYRLTRYSATSTLVTLYNDGNGYLELRDNGRMIEFTYSALTKPVRASHIIDLYESL